MSFVHLHVHSHYSFLDGASSLDRLLDKALELGMPALALTDHNRLTGAIRFYDRARARGIKPVIGSEIDIECGRWADSNDVHNAQFVVQPWDWSGHLVRYSVPREVRHSTHVFTWEPHQIAFESLVGSFSPAPPPSEVLGRHCFTNAPAVPPAGDENVRINLWLIYGFPPTDGNEAEIILSRFDFVPLGSPEPARLTAPGRNEMGLMQFEIRCLPDWRGYHKMSETCWTEWRITAGALISLLYKLSVTFLKSPC